MDVQKTGSLVLGATVSIFLVACSLPRAAFAQEADSNAFGEFVDLTADLLPLVNGGEFFANSGPLPQLIEGPTTQTYGPTVSSLPNVTVALSSIDVLDAGLLTVQTQFDAATNLVSSQASVDGLAIDLGIIPLIQGLGLTADGVASSAQVSGPCGAFQPTGTTTFDNARVTLPGLPDIPLPASPPPNTLVDVSALGINGISIVVNEQIVTDGALTKQMIVNPIHITLAINLAGLLTMSGEIIVGQAEVGLTTECVPGNSEAAMPTVGTWGLWLSVGVLLLIGATQSRRRRLTT